MRRRKRLKKSVRIIFFIIILFILLTFRHSIFQNSFKIISTKYNDDTLIIEYNTDYKDIYCYVSKENTTPTLAENSWVKGTDNKCSIPLEINNTYYLYIKNNDKIILNNMYNELVTFNENRILEDIYIASNDEYKLFKDYLIIGDITSIIYSGYDNKIISMNNNVITPISNGTTKLTITSNEYVKTINITVTDLITKAESNFDFEKGYLKCNQYTKADNDLLDSILKSRINDAEYKTRAASVAAARFLTLELPYRVDYFYENGRIAFRSTKVDGEGRYYHVGLYLSQDRTSNIEYKSKGPAAWGCSIYNSPAKRNMSNGLDCSGFVSWVLLNAGYDPGDVGAGITDVYDLTDTGERKTLTYSLANSDTIKSGDLIWKSAGGGHIAIIVGIDDKNYYVAEALWDDYPEKGVIINTYSKANFHNNYKYVILMDSYYEKDGNYSKLWY